MPKLVDHRERRQSIANAAIEVIDTHGLDGVRLRDVARQADVTTGAVTHYFSGKDEMLVAALDQVAGRILAQLDRVAEADDLLAAIELALPADEAGVRDMRVWLAYWGRAISNAEMAEIHHRYYDTFRERLGREVALRQADGRLPAAGEPADIANAVIAAIDGIGTRAALEPDEWPVDRQQRTLRLMLGPLLTPTSNRPA